MKTLYIVRHAKSSWEDPKTTDINRPLIEKGIKRTIKTINFLIEKKIILDAIISSHAKRAFDTAKIIADGLNFAKQNIIINKNIYETDMEGILEEVLALPDNYEKVMLVSHNPGVTQFVNNYLDAKIDYLPTSAIVSLSFQTNKWENIDSCYRKTNFVVYPKEFK